MEKGSFSRNLNYTILLAVMFYVMVPWLEIGQRRLNAWPLVVRVGRNKKMPRQHMTAASAWACSLTGNREGGRCVFTLFLGEGRGHWGKSALPASLHHHLSLPSPDP